MKLTHVVSTKQFLNTEILDELFEIADEMENRDKNGEVDGVLKGKILANLFYEPSTRTRFSFESAMQKLGGSVITTEDASKFSSVTKGEVLEDTIRIISGYVDVIVLRHYEKGSAKIAAEISDVPVINAGDGVGEHPTQALLDLYTIKKELGRVDNLNVAFVGDLLYGRTIHSLLNLFTLYKNVKIYLVSPTRLKLPEEYKEVLRKNGIEFREVINLGEVMNKVDVLYMTRVQKERFDSKEEYEKLNGYYVLDERLLRKLKRDAIVMHPLPRVNEISHDIDKDKRAAYFRQAKNGLYIRMALLKMIFGK